MNFMPLGQTENRANPQCWVWFLAGAFLKKQMPVSNWHLSKLINGIFVLANKKRRHDYFLNVRVTNPRERCCPYLFFSKQSRRMM